MLHRYMNPVSLVNYTFPNYTAVKTIFKELLHFGVQDWFQMKLYTCDADFLDGFRSGRGTGTAIMELKLAQDLASIDQDPLFLVFLDILKAYDTVDQDRLIITLKGYGSGPRMCGILGNLWYCQKLVPRKNGFHRLVFPITRGTTQGVIVTLTLFNVVVDKFIRNCLTVTVEYQRVAQHGLVETVARCMGVFYANNGMVSLRDPDWLQHAMNVLVGLFRRYFLAANVAKSHTIPCLPGLLRAGMSEEAMELKLTGVGYTFRVRL